MAAVGRIAAAWFGVGLIRSSSEAPCRSPGSGAGVSAPPPGVGPSTGCATAAAKCRVKKSIILRRASSSSSASAGVYTPRSARAPPAARAQ
ncbi:MAG: hypothetical protein ACKO3G_06275 [Planctomycetaceae bacterium]